MVAIFDASGSRLSVHDGGKKTSVEMVQDRSVLSHSSHFFFKVFLSSSEDENIDIYRLKIGVRSLHWNSKEFLINGKPIYFRGFGRHEDSDVSSHFMDLKTENTNKIV